MQIWSQVQVPWSSRKGSGGWFSDELSFAFDGERAEHMAISSAESNFVDPDVRKQLRTKKVIAFHPPRCHNSADSLHCDAARSPSYTVSGTGFGRLLEGNSTAVRCKERENPRTTGGDRGRSI